MIKKAEDVKEVIKEKMLGGEGSVILKPFASKEEMMNNSRMFGFLTFKKDCGIGVHTHVDEVECMYVLKGKGHYISDGEEYTVNEGEVLICENGHSHGITNREEEDLVVIANILVK